LLDPLLLQRLACPAAFAEIPWTRRFCSNSLDLLLLQQLAGHAALQRLAGPAAFAETRLPRCFCRDSLDLLLLQRLTGSLDLLLLQ
jgi:hypothetical protein